MAETSKTWVSIRSKDRPQQFIERSTRSQRALTPAPLLFINISEPHENKEERARAVRRFVMEQHSRKRKSDLALGLRISGRKTIVSPSNLDATVLSRSRVLSQKGYDSLTQRCADAHCPGHVHDDMRLMTDYRPQNAKPLPVLLQRRCPYPRTYLDAGNVDPFDSLPIKGQRDMFELLEEYITAPLSWTQIRKSTNQLRRTLCVPIALKSAAGAHAIIVAAAAFSGKPKNHALIQQHSREAIRAINNALSKKSAYEEDDAAVDSICLGILMLATTAYLNKDDKAFDLHFKGLIALVERHGGLHQRGFLAAAIISAVFNQDMMAAGKALGEVWQPPSLGFLDRTFSPFAKGDLCGKWLSGFGKLAGDSLISHEFHTVMIKLSALGPLSIRDQYGQLTIRELQIFMATLFSGGQQLLRWNAATLTHLENCCRVAALIHLFVVTIASHSTLCMIKVDADVDKEASDIMEPLRRLDEVIYESPQACLWIGLLAGGFQQGGVRRLVQGPFRTACCLLGVQTWEECMVHVKKFLWVESEIFEQPCRDFWDMLPSPVLAEEIQFDAGDDLLDFVE